MKKQFTLTMLFITLSINSQDYAHISNPLVDVAIYKGSDANSLENALTVSAGTFITFSSKNGDWLWAFPDGSTSGYANINPGLTVLPEGYKFYYDGNSNDNGEYYHLIVTIHEYASSGSTFSYTEAELNNRVKLFPNPITSEVALNSEKNYKIEVFDILGNKIMELVGNSINMEHLSRATYIVNAVDVVSQESLSYKVIKK